MKRFALLAAFAAALVSMTTVLAHAEPATVKPGDGAVLSQPPAEVAIVMGQEMARQAGASDIQVFDSSGVRVTTVSAVIDNGDRKKISVPLPSNLAVGTYTVKWKTLSADDGDDASGQLTFTYDPSKPASPGKERLLESPAGTTATATSSNPSGALDGDTGGTSWVLVVAVAIGMFALGCGVTFLLFTRKAA